MPQRLYWIQAGSTDGRNHTADESYNSEDDGRGDQRSRSYDQPNISGLAVFSKRTIQGEPAVGINFNHNLC